MSNLYYNLKTSLSGDNVCDQNWAFEVKSGKINTYKGTKRGLLRIKYDYVLSSTLSITDGTRLWVTKLKGGAGMITVSPPNSDGQEFHIYGNIDGFVNDIKRQVKVEME